MIMKSTSKLKICYKKKHLTQKSSILYYILVKLVKIKVVETYTLTYLLAESSADYQIRFLALLKLCNTMKFPNLD